jgi:hypothetical protein
MQTLAGLALDTKRKHSRGKDTPSVPSPGDLTAIQYLLNAFMLLNIFQFMVLMTLAHLDRRRKAALVTIADIYGSSDETTPGNFDEDQSSSPKSVDYPDNHEGAEGSIRLSLSAREGPIPPAASSEQSHPLFVSDAERLPSAMDPDDPNSSPQVPRSNTPKTNQVKRGELFARLSAALVVFAWVLFIATAWLRLRSKAEREEATTGVIVH